MLILLQFSTLKINKNNKKSIQKKLIEILYFFIVNDNKQNFTQITHLHNINSWPFAKYAYCCFPKPSQLEAFHFYSNQNQQPLICVQNV
jgi:hypothetical protein